MEDVSEVDQTSYRITLGFDDHLLTYPLTILTEYRVCGENVVMRIQSEVTYEYTIKSDRLTVDYTELFYSLVVGCSLTYTVSSDRPAIPITYNDENLSLYIADYGADFTGLW